MGLLDDAIREHLDLKRRRGADPADIERAEREALGPVRRGPADAEPPELVLDETHTYEHAAEQEAWDDHEQAEEEHDAPVAAATAPDVPPAPAPPAEPFDDDPFDDDDDDPFAERPAAERVEEPAPHQAPAGDANLGETVEYDIEQEFEDEEHVAAAHHDSPKPKGAEGADEDPLEETPEFLQDTPDHDRLWFEQRPPKDFDFDG